MGRKMNNMPIRKQRKKKIKDPQNHQIKGKSGRGRKRVTGQANKIRDKILGKGKFGQGKQAATVEIRQDQISWVEMAKAQEKVLAEREEKEEGLQPVKLSKKAKKRQKAREAAEGEKPQPMERSFAPGGGVRRGTVEFGFFDDDDEVPGSAPTPSASSAATPAADAPAQRPGEGLAVGRRVAILGLRNAPTLNGKLGACVRWDAPRQRWLVKLESSGDEKLLKAENLRLYRAPATVALSPFALVRITGLLGAMALNGRLATCRSFDEEKRRWLVDVEKEGGEKLLRPENLQPVLQRGSSVRLHGLTGAVALNGQRGVCLAFDDGRKRWRVRLADGEEKFLLAENLEFHGDQRPPLVSVFIRQSVVVCKEKDKALELVTVMKKRREAEKRGSVLRDRILVFCSDADGQAQALHALRQNQFGCTVLDGRREMKQALAQFGLDQKQVLVATDAAAAKLKLEEPVGLVVSYGFPEDMRVYGKRLRHLQQDAEGGEAIGFCTEAEKAIAAELVATLERTMSPVDPALRALVPKEVKPEPSADAARSRKRPRKRRRTEGPQGAGEEGGEAPADAPCGAGAATADAPSGGDADLGADDGDRGGSRAAGDGGGAPGPAAAAEDGGA